MPAGHDAGPVRKDDAGCRGPLRLYPTGHRPDGRVLGGLGLLDLHLGWKCLYCCSHYQCAEFFLSDLEIEPYVGCCSGFILYLDLIMGQFKGCKRIGQDPGSHNNI